MSDTLETVSILINGQPFSVWSRFQHDCSAEEAVRTAGITAHITPDMTPPWPDQKVVISAGSTLLLTGYVRDFRPSQQEESWDAEITFVSRTIDAVEASVVHSTGLAKDKDVGEIATEFDTCGVGVICEGSYEKHERHQISPSESLFETLEPLARAEGAIITDTPEGKLRITNKPDKAHAGGLVAGKNIISASAEFSGREKHDPVYVRGQQSRGGGAASLRPEAEARDPSVGRKRPKIVLLETEVTSGRLKKRSEWQARRAAGAATSAQVTVSGWRDAAGDIWTANRLVYVQHPRIFIDQMMVIKSVSLTQDQSEGGEGTRAVLTLADPRALGGKSGKSKSGAGWEAPEPKSEYRAQ